MNLFTFRCRKFTVFALIVAVLFAPTLVLAQPGVDTPIVPDCGDINKCGYCDLVVLGQNIVNFLVFLAVLVAILLFVHAGILLLIGGSSEAKRTQAKKIFFAAVLGLLLTLGAWLIINLLMSVFLNADFNVWTLPECNVDIVG